MPPLSVPICPTCEKKLKRARADRTGTDLSSIGHAATTELVLRPIPHRGASAGGWEACCPRDGWFEIVGRAYRPVAPAARAK